MEVDLARELLDELGSSLERLETQLAAVFGFLKDEGIVSDDQLAPYLTEAGTASGVRWRAVRVRLEHLISAAAAKEEQKAQPAEHPAARAQTPRSEEKEREETPKGQTEEEPGQKGQNEQGQGGAQRPADAKPQVDQEESEKRQPKPETPEGRSEMNEAERGSPARGSDKDAA